MHILIITDCEGISCVDDIEMMNENNLSHQKARELLMDDINAAISGLFDGGATKVTVVDGHHSGTNFIKEELDPRAVELPIKEFSTMKIGTVKFDGICCIGCHAMAGTEKAFLDHTQSAAAWFDYCINGKKFGEIGQQAIWAGADNIPLIMVSGDEAACNEAKELVDGVSCAVVKTANERNKAICIPKTDALKLIYDAAKCGIENINTIKPIKVQLPCLVELTLAHSEYCDEIMKASPELKRVGRTITKILKNITSYRDLVAF